MRRRTLVMVPVLAVVLALAATLLPPVGHNGAGNPLGVEIADARRRISIPFGLDSVQLSRSGKFVVVTGPVGCEDDGSHYRVDVHIVQDGVHADGHATGPCTGEAETFTLRAVVKGPGRLEAGDASGTGLFRNFYRGDVTDTHTWTWRDVIS